MTNVETYSAGKAYEDFICRVFLCDVDKHGAQSAMQTLLEMDYGRSTYFKPKDYEKRLQTARTNFVKAIDKALRQQLAPADLLQLQLIREKAESATMARAIAPLVRAALDATDDLKNSRVRK